MEDKCDCTSPRKRDEIWSQYDRFLKQAQIEIHEVYWLFNFFFLADSALIGYYFFGEFESYQITPIFFGMALSVIWLIALNKQIGWREWWIDKIKKLQTKDYLDLHEDLKMWDNPEHELSILEKIKDQKRGL